MEFLPTALDTVALGRWQFGITTVYHFILVPLTIGLSLAVAIMQTMWVRSGKEVWLKATRFFGKLLLINFALGVATGIVQEFQFGMNWSEYSRFVGDIFGAPLAVEALLAFFLESTFLGLWIFGWGRISKKVHLATIWLFAAGVNLSALWILTANSWMQHPTGAGFNAETGRAELAGASGFFQLLANPVTWTTFSHVITSAWLLTGTFIAGIAIWWMTRAMREGSKPAVKEATDIWRPISRYGLLIVIIGGIGTLASGHVQGQEMVKFQPAKMAAAEAICVTQESAPFTVMTFDECPTDLDEANANEPSRFIEVPGLASFLANNSFSSEAEGVANLQQEMVERLNANTAFTDQYGDADQYDFTPPQQASFWSFRLMMVFGAFSAVLALWALITMRSKKTPSSKALGRFALISVPMPFVGASFGWIFTEMGRQPWVVHPNIQEMASGSSLGNVFMMTDLGVSTSISATEVLITMVAFTLLYAVLGVIWVILMRRFVQEGMYRDEGDSSQAGDNAETLSFGY